MVKFKQLINLIVFYILIIIMQVKSDCITKKRPGYQNPCYTTRYFYPVYFDGIQGYHSGEYFSTSICNDVNLDDKLIQTKLNHSFNVQHFNIFDSVISSLSAFKDNCFIQISNCTLNVSFSNLVDANPLLTSLEIRSSNLSTFDINPIPSLRILDLSNNSLSSLNTEKFRQLKLDILNVSSNRISNIYCDNVKYEIDLRNNGLDVINCTFAKTLKNLYLNDNYLKNISKYAFENLHSLNSLNLSYNEMDEVANIFSDLNSLLYLNLSNNMINRLHFECFANLTALKILDLSYNKINEIPFGIFSGLGRLRILDLSYNNIFKLDLGVFFPCRILEELELEGNDLEDLNINILKKFRLNKISFSFHDISCQKLKKYIDLLKHNEIRVKTGQFLYFDNVNGILCTIRNSTDLYKTSFELSLNSLMKTHVTLTIIAICFLILMFLFVIVLHYRSKL